MYNIDEVRKYFKTEVFSQEITGIEIDAVDENYARCSLKLDERHGNLYGNAMGGVIYTLADFTFGVASVFNRDYPTVTSTSNINFLNGAKIGSTLYSEAKVLKDGQRICFCEVFIRDETGKDIAQATITGIHLRDVKIDPNTRKPIGKVDETK